MKQNFRTFECSQLSHGACSIDCFLSAVCGLLGRTRGMSFKKLLIHNLLSPPFILSHPFCGSFPVSCVLSSELASSFWFVLGAAVAGTCGPAGQEQWPQGGEGAPCQPFSLKRALWGVFQGPLTAMAIVKTSLAQCLVIKH